MSELTSHFESPLLLVDALYSPWQPPLTVHQLSAQGEVITGLDLLCAQALDQIAFMTGESFDKDEMFSFLREVVEVTP
jgi:shikimate 5-dehydrogenase